MSLYEDEIQVISSSCEAIRRRPEFYVGPLDDPRLLNRLLQEALCIAVDEVVNGHCAKIEIEVQKCEQITIRDHGRGISMKPLGHGKTLVELLFTSVGACRDHKESSQIGVSCCQVGLVVVNALSEWLRVRNFHDRFVWQQEFIRGVPVGPPQRVSETNETGLEMSFLLDGSIVKEQQFDALSLLSWLQGVGVRIGTVSIESQDDATTMVLSECESVEIPVRANPAQMK